MVHLEVIRSIHSPGLDLSGTRMTGHRLIQESLHEFQEMIGAFAWNSFEEQGRGYLYIAKATWRDIIREGFAVHGFPGIYVAEGNEPPADLSELGQGFPEMIRVYEPELSFVIVVEYARGNFTAAHWIQPVPFPMEAAAAGMRSSQ